MPTPDNQIIIIHREDLEAIIKRQLEPISQRILSIESSVTLQNEFPITQEEVMSILGIKQAQFYNYIECGALTKISGSGRPGMFSPSHVRGAKERYKEIQRRIRTNQHE